MKSATAEKTGTRAQWLQETNYGKIGEWTLEQCCKYMHLSENSQKKLSGIDTVGQAKHAVRQRLEEHIQAFQQQAEAYQGIITLLCEQLTPQQLAAVASTLPNNRDPTLPIKENHLQIFTALFKRLQINP
jgi:phosphoenolpyruvate carboxylase